MLCCSGSDDGHGVLLVIVEVGDDLKLWSLSKFFSMFCSVVTMLQTSVSLQTIAIIAKFSDITLIAQSVSQSAETIMIAGATGAWQRTVSCKTSSTAQKLTPTSTLL